MLQDVDKAPSRGAIGSGDVAALASLLLNSSWTSFFSPPCIRNETSHHFTLKLLFPVIKSASAEGRQIFCKPAVEGRHFVSFIGSFQAAEIHYLALIGRS